MHSDPRSSHQQITRMVRELNRGPVLDVGAAHGIIGQLLQGSGLPVDAIEPNLAWAQAAERFYRSVYAATIEQADLPRAHYRVIVCGDVLEHTINPLAALAKLRQAATPDAVFIISLPNIAHIAVRLALLFGRFPRMQRGILDRTHLHFFTRDSAEQLLREAGLEVTGVSCTPVPLDTYWRNNRTRPLARLSMRAQHAALVLLPRLFAMQWIFVARQAAVTNPATSPDMAPASPPSPLPAHEHSSA
jgi:2-polyprenyl-3-methyl-5-hydroxy-6-metoxy-1,4-benzoquinol methylase